MTGSANHTQRVRSMVLLDKFNATTHIPHTTTYQNQNVARNCARKQYLFAQLCVLVIRFIVANIIMLCCNRYRHRQRRFHFGRINRQQSTPSRLQLYNFMCYQTHVNVHKGVSMKSKKTAHTFCDDDDSGCCREYMIFLKS